MSRLADTAARQADDIDARYHPSAAVRRQLNKVFPTHWSFLLGEIALYSFIVLLITGVYLTLFFDPSMTAVTYHGVYQPLRGVEMSKAYASTLDISFEVRGGLFVRQVHHWAALMFAASIMVHLARDLFHRRVPPAARSQLGHRFAAADPGDVRGLLRLLAARRPAVGNRAARSVLVDHVGDAGDRHLAALGPVRRRLPRRHHHPAPVRAAHSVAARDHPGADRRAPGLRLVPEAHPVPRPRPHRTQRRRRARDAGVRRQIRRLLRPDHRSTRPDGRPAADQPHLEPRPLQALPDISGQPTRLLHDVAGRPGPALAGMGVLHRPSHRPRGQCGSH